MKHNNSENDAVLNYFINPDTLRIKVTYIDQELDAQDYLILHRK